MQIERKISFSVYRLLLFESCRRAYYYRYIASWNGWDKAADPVTREIYFLKNLISEEIFFSEILKKSFNILISEKAIGNKNTDLLKIALNEYRKNFNIFAENNKKHPGEGKNKTLSDLYYKTRKTTEDLYNFLLEKLKRTVAIFADSPFFSIYSNTSYLQFRDLNTPESFDMYGIRVFLSPMSLKISNNAAEIVLLHLGDFENIPFWDFSASIAEIYVRTKFKINCVSCRSLFFRENRLLSVWAARPEIETEKLVKEKTAEIFSFENETVKEPEERKIMHCSNCEFRKICN